MCYDSMEIAILRAIFGRNFVFNETATTGIYTNGHTLSLHDALPIAVAKSSPPDKRITAVLFTQKAFSAPACRPRVACAIAIGSAPADGRPESIRPVVSVPAEPDSARAARHSGCRGRIDRKSVV